MDENKKDSETKESLPAHHQFGRFITGSVAGYVASELAKKGYDWAYRTIQARKSA